MTLRANVKDYGAYADALRDDYYGWATCAAAILAAGGGTMVIDGTPRLRTSINLQGVNIEALPGTRATADGGVTVSGSGVLFLAEPVATVFAGAGTWNLTGRQAVAGGVTSTVVAATTPAAETFGAAGTAGSVGTVSDSGHIHPLSAAAGGDLAGSTYPNPAIAAGAVTAAKIANNTITAGQLAAGAATGAALGTDVVTTGKGLVQLGVVALGAVQASVTFSAIPQTYRHLLLDYAAFDSSATNGPDNLLAQFNGDTTADYDWAVLNINGTTVAGADAYAQTSMQVGLCGGGGIVGAGSHPAFGQLLIPNYSNISFNKGIHGSSGYPYGTATGTIFNTLRTATARNNAAVASLTLLPSVGSFGIGSVFSLYGVA